MLSFPLYMAQRLSSLIMASLTLGHNAVMIYAVQGGLSTAAILGRTQGSIFWMLFDGLFVLAVPAHAAIGVRVIMHEHVGLKGTGLEAFTYSACILLMVLGMQALLAVTWPMGAS